MLDAIKRHWPEYLMEAAGLGLFMISACLFGTVLEHPTSPMHQAIENPVARRVLMGLAMGGTAIALIYSPWGKQSGAHLNPSVTLTFLRLGKVAPWDAAFYVVSQFVGGLVGVLIMAAVLGSALAVPSVHYVVTAPGPHGPVVAFLAEKHGGPTIGTKPRTHDVSDRLSVKLQEAERQFEESIHVARFGDAPNDSARHVSRPPVRQNCKA